MDKIDKIVIQWNEERPDLDLSGFQLVGRFKLISQHLSREMDKTFATFGLTHSSFDVLATLRRSGSPYGLSPNELLESTMVTSGTMTNRIDQLEKAGLVERKRNPKDGRSVIITLTKKGFAVVDKAVAAHMETLTRLTSSLSEKDSAALKPLLSKFLTCLEEGEL